MVSIRTTCFSKVHSVMYKVTYHNQLYMLKNNETVEDLDLTEYYETANISGP